MAIGTAHPAVSRVQTRIKPQTPPPRIQRAPTPWLDEMALHKATSHAVHGLARAAPHFSAQIVVWWRQILVLAAMVGTFTWVSVVIPSNAWLGFMTALALPFACLAMFRTVAVVKLVGSCGRAEKRYPRMSDAVLPYYSIFVPLYDEANMAAQIVTALSELDYPAEKLEVLIILERDDYRTRSAFAATAMPGHFKVVTLPFAPPQTKPKALDAVLSMASGDYVVVYDAEDLPDPRQLRAAVAMFDASPANVACIQARLVIHNTQESWLTRQFSIEYLGLFDGILPAYQSLGLPLPLGGTSNHFPRHALKAMGGWDPFNVTEDADLGIRLARLGYQARMLNSQTWEEAPPDLKNWLPQRTRWLKGWMQTYLVHTRQPFRLMRELGPFRWVGFHAIFAGMVLAALFHPLVYILLAWQFLTIGPFAEPAAVPEFVFVGLTAFNLALGYGSAVALGISAAICRRQYKLLTGVLTIPFYWLLISFAAWRALIQLAADPFKWEKTPHRIKV